MSIYDIKGDEEIGPKIEEVCEGKNLSEQIDLLADEFFVEGSPENVTLHEISASIASLRAEVTKLREHIEGCWQQLAHGLPGGMSDKEVEGFMAILAEPIDGLHQPSKEGER